MALTVSQILALTRKYIVDEVEPYGVSDEFLIMFLNEAQRELALVGKLLRKVVTFDIVADDRFISLSSAKELGTGAAYGYLEVLEYRKAVIVDENDVRYPMRLQGTLADTTQDNMVWDYGIYRYSSNVLAPGRPNTLVFGTATDFFELSPISDKAYTIEADVIVHPITQFDVNSMDDEPEISEKYHILLPFGVAVRALQIADFYDVNQNKQAKLEDAWQRALAKVAAETGAISRDHGPVKFTNDIWSGY